MTANPAAIHQGFTEVLPAAPLPSSTYIDRISAILPLLIVVDLIYAHFLNKSREQKEIVFNSYWENKNFLVNVLENLNMVSLFKKHERSGFLHLSCFFDESKQVASATCFMFHVLSKVVVGPQHTRSVLMVGKFQTDLIC